MLTDHDDDGEDLQQVQQSTTVQNNDKKQQLQNSLSTNSVIFHAGIEIIM